MFIPPLQGQYKIWSNDIKHDAHRVDEIICFGNLIGTSDLVKDKDKRGPNVSTLNYTQNLWRSTDDNWTQLVGPNEIMALNFPDEWTNTESNRMLRRFWFDPKDKSEFVVATVNKSRLVTHGGLTYGEWVSIGEPETATEAANLLNAKYMGKLYLGNCFALQRRPHFDANPVFADPIREVYPSWVYSGREMPFSQVHSENGLNTVDGRESLTSPLSPLSYLEDVTYEKFGSVAHLDGQFFISVAPEYHSSTLIKKIPEPWSVYIEKTRMEAK